MTHPARQHGIGDQSALKPYYGDVYHYTSSAGLLGIVSTGQLRASEASALNDLAEIELGWEAIEKWVSRRTGSRGVEHIEGLINDARRDPKHQVFVLSGTTAGDDANQWRLYADDGKGYAIELDANVPLGVVSLDKPVKDKKTSSTTFGAMVRNVVDVVPWFHVIYGKRGLHKELDALADYCEIELDRINRVEGPEEYQLHEYEAFEEETLEELEMIAHLYKLRGFRGEQEVRVVARFTWFGPHVGYRPGAYGIAGHIFLVGTDPASGVRRTVVQAPSMEDASKPGFAHPLPITKVRLGPLIHDGNTESVKAFLKKYGLGKVGVKRSKVPLR
jgi:hypothetical protein